MITRELELSNFRNYSSQKVEFSPGVNIITGDNGQGKTNLLEAVYFISHLKSNRVPRMRELVFEGRRSASVRAVIMDGEKRMNFMVAFGEKGKTVEVNGQRMETVARAKGLFKCVMFSPDDLYLVKGEPADRRAFLDETMEELGPLEARRAAEYRHILRQRNAVLRKWEEGGSALVELLEPWNQSLAREGALVMAARRGMTARMAVEAAERYREIAGPGKELGVRYEPSLESDAGCVEEEEERLYTALREALPAEKRARMTLVGPHRDDLEIELGGRRARHSASQGEQRTAAFCLRLAQAEYVERETGKKPVLLLDDVMSELDSARRAGVLRLAAADTQSIITTTEAPGKGAPEAGRVMAVEAGDVKVV